MDRREPLAIVGIGCRLPGDVTSPDDYWNLLCGDTDATRVVPETRWNAARFHDPTGGRAGKMVTRRGGYLTEIDQFDAQFFGVSPREANLLDPQQRLLLHTTWEALEDGGIPADGLAGTDVGVFVGGFTLDYQLLQNQGRTSRFRFKTHSATGMMMTMLANRISFAFDFRGPSMAIDTACSSSLVAVHLAAQSIWNDECSLAIAGGVNVIVGPNTAIAESTSGFLSPDGRCKAFDESADGYARGEGAAVVVVKPLADAVRDGDEVYAQILGSAVTQDGHTDAITVPSEDAQRAAISTALQRAGVRAADVGYVEAHGTGTPVGDPVELRALAGALAADRPAGDPLLIGSVKTNIGHLEAGAGVAGLIKAALVLRHGHIPAHLHLDNPTSRIPFAELNIDVPRTGRPFPGTGRRIAGVNSFGFGGTNAHVVLAQPPAPTPVAAPVTPAPLTILPISARGDTALAAVARRLADHLAAHPDLTLPDLAHTLSRHRAHLSHRRALVVQDLDDAREQLESVAASDGQGVAGRGSTTAPKLAFVCTGMGPQWWRMCRGLLDTHPVFADTVARTDRELSRYADWSLLDELRRDEADSRMDRTEIAQPANFAVQIALSAQLQHYGVTPDAIVGHSAGEVAAHHLAGLLTFEQAVRVIYHRSRLQQRTSGLGRMLAVGLDTDRLTTTLDDGALAEFGHRVSIAAINGPTAVTIAGDGEVLDDIARQLDDADVFHRYLTGTVPYHTHYMDAVKDDLHDALAGLSSATARIPLYSTVTGERLDEYSGGAAYWWQNTRATVLFDAAARRMLEDGYTHFVELGPHPVLASAILEIAGTQPVSVLPAQRRDADDVRTLLQLVGALHGHGCDIDWDALNPRARRVRLPSYPWQSRRFWNEPPEATEDLHYRPVHPLLGQPVSGVHPTWEVELGSAAIPFLADHRVQGFVVLPGAVFLEMALAAAAETYGSAHTVEDLVLHRALILDDTCDPIVRTTLNRERGSVEFTAFTATADGDFAWALTATADLGILPPRPPRGGAPAGAALVAMDGEDFYARTRDMGFGYGDAFQPVTAVTAGEDWAASEITVPATIVEDLEAFHFHPALADGAFQTLFAATFGGDDAGDTYVPTRIRCSAVYAPPEKEMTVAARVVSASAEEIESDLTVRNRVGDTLAVFTGFTVRSLSSHSATSAESIDRGLYEMAWVGAADIDRDEPTGEARSWLVLADATGFGGLVGQQLRTRGHRVTEVAPRATGPHDEAWFADLLATHLDTDGDLAGIVNCWPLDIAEAAENSSAAGVLPILHLVTALAGIDGVTPRLHLVTANAQPALGTEPLAPDHAAVWGLGRVIGHQEFAGHWGGLIDLDLGPDTGPADRADAARRVCQHVLDPDAEDQIALRGATTLVPRLRPCASLTPPFPTRLTPDATYVVTGGTGALGRVVVEYLAERGARHIALLSRSEIPPRSEWAQLDSGHRHYATVRTVERAERLGADVVCAAVDVTDARQVRGWLDEHTRRGGRQVRGVLHTAGVVDDRLLLNMTEADFAKVLAPKVIGTRVLHDAFEGLALEFFVMFGSAGSVIASPGQGNYAAANAFLDTFAHYRRARGLPALTIGWGPWSVGMVAELKLERIYAQRGIELITPMAGARILDRLLHQRTPAVVAITADWNRARQAGLAGRLPPMFTDLETEDSAADAEAGGSILAVLADTAEPERLGVITEHVRRGAAAVFDCAVTDIAPDEALDEIGLDSLMAMEFRVRINAAFAIDLPVLEILRGVSVDSLAARILAELDVPVGDAPAETSGTPDGVEALIDGMSDDELRVLLAELEGS